MSALNAGMLSFAGEGCVYEVEDDYELEYGKFVARGYAEEGGWLRVEYVEESEFVDKERYVDEVEFGKGVCEGRSIYRGGEGCVTYRRNM